LKSFHNSSPSLAQGYPLKWGKYLASSPGYKPDIKK